MKDWFYEKYSVKDLKKGFRDKRLRVVFQVLSYLKFRFKEFKECSCKRIEEGFVHKSQVAYLNDVTSIAYTYQERFQHFRPQLSHFHRLKCHNIERCHNVVIWGHLFWSLFFRVVLHIQTLQREIQFMAGRSFT